METSFPVNHCSWSRISSGLVVAACLIATLTAFEANADTGRKYDVAAGATFKVNASDVALIGGFAEKLQLFITNGALGAKKKRIRVVEHSNESVTCLFNEKIR